MQMIDFPAPRTRPTLLAFAEDSSCTASYIKDIKLAELAYFKNRAPAVLQPVGLCNLAGDFLRARYKSPSLKYRTDWINSLRDDHELTSCPMCGHTGVAELDHFLPKEKYPEFSCFPYNLVPSCQTCNKKRGVRAGQAPLGRDFIHPYFDSHVLSTLELSVEVVEPFDAPAYNMVCHSLAGLAAARVAAHLEASINPKVLRRVMNSYWKFWWRKIGRELSMESAKEKLLTELSDSSAVDRNSWSTAFFRGVHNNEEVISWWMNNQSR